MWRMLRERLTDVNEERPQAFPRPDIVTGGDKITELRKCPDVLTWLRTTSRPAIDAAAAWIRESRVRRAMSFTLMPDAP